MHKITSQFLKFILSFLPVRFKSEIELEKPIFSDALFNQFLKSITADFESNRNFDVNSENATILFSLNFIKALLRFPPIPWHYTLSAITSGNIIVKYVKSMAKVEYSLNFVHVFLLFAGAYFIVVFNIFSSKNFPDNIMTLGIVLVFMLIGFNAIVFISNYWFRALINQIYISITD